MSRELQQATRVFHAIRRITGGRLSVPATIVVGVFVVGFLWWSGADLPTEPIPDNRPAVKTERSESADSGDLLSSIGGKTYESPAGLRYSRGSRHGHRLAHVMAHSRDEPGRAGQHGVFDADEPEAVVKLLDDAYEQAQSGRRVETRREDGRVVYTVDVGRRVGYIGGQSGGRRGHPSARHVRLVLEGDRVITAYPVIP